MHFRFHFARGVPFCSPFSARADSQNPNQGARRGTTVFEHMLVTQDSTENPRVLTWGRGQYGQLGHNSQPTNEVAAPTAVPQLEGRPVARLACGQFHTAAVVAGPKGSGGVLTWGRGTLGVLGHGDEEDRLEPQAVEPLAGVDLVDTGTTPQPCRAYRLRGLQQTVPI